jgi:multiple antibiotic resistance protein
MPVLIGPATVSVSVLAGQRMSPVFAATSIFTAVFLSIFVIMLLKQIHDYVRPRNEVIVERYIEIMGRITALVIGTFAIEMIMLGIKGWFPG